MQARVARHLKLSAYYNIAIFFFFPLYPLYLFLLFFLSHHFPTPFIVHIITNLPLSISRWILGLHYICAGLLCSSYFYMMAPHTCRPYRQHLEDPYSIYSQGKLQIRRKYTLKIQLTTAWWHHTDPGSTLSYKNTL